MPDIGKIFKDEIRRLAAKEVRTLVGPLTREVRSLKRAVSEQRRLIQGMLKTQQRLTAEADARRADELKASEEEVKSARLNSGSIKRLRSKFGLSRESFASLLGVSANAVYLWESGKATPRTRAKAKLVEMRKLGVREVRRRLEEIETAED